MEIRWIDNAGEFDSLRGEWDQLLANSASDCVFLTWDWLRTWWIHLGARHRLRIVTVRNEGRLIAVAPLVVRPGSLRRLFPFPAVEFLGSGTAGSDYLDFIVRKGDEADALSALCSALSRPDLMLEFGQLRTSGCAAATLGNRLGQQGWQSIWTIVNICPFINLRGHTWTTYLATLGSQHRHDLQRKTNNLAKQFKVAFERVEREEQRDPALQLLIALHNKRWSERGGSDAFHTAGHLAFHSEFTALALRRGWLRLYILRLDGNPVSALYGLRYGPTFYFFQSGFDARYARYSVGLVTMGLAIKSALEEGAEEYDLLHGSEAYKFHWARESHALSRLELFPPGARGLCFRAMTGGRRLAGGLLRAAFHKTAPNTLTTTGPVPAASSAGRPINHADAVAAAGEKH